MNAAPDKPIPRVPWITEQDFKNTLERLKNMTREQQHQSLIDGGILDENGKWLNPPYGLDELGPKIEPLTLREFLRRYGSKKETAPAL